MPGVTFRYRARSPRPAHVGCRLAGRAPHLWVAGCRFEVGWTASLAGRGPSWQRWGHTNRPHRSLNREGEPAMQPTASSTAARLLGVNPALTPNRPADAAPTRSPARRSRRRRGHVENGQFAAFVRRIIAAHGRRVAAGDVEGLAELLALADELDAATRTAVEGLRRFGYSWAEIASRLGTTRQAAQQRWGR
jgi:hypothetical protein